MVQDKANDSKRDSDKLTTEERRLLKEAKKLLKKRKKELDAPDDGGAAVDEPLLPEGTQVCRYSRSALRFYQGRAEQGGAGRGTQAIPDSAHHEDDCIFKESDFLI